MKDELNGVEIREEVLKRLQKYEGRNLLEQFALYLGMAQILEWS